MAVDGQRFMTKTQHYRKVTKPLLERKRRARMNLYLDELKDLIVDTMEAQGEHVTKLEKADILEMTVNYLKMHKNEITTTQFDPFTNSQSPTISPAPTTPPAASRTASTNSSLSNSDHNDRNECGVGVNLEKFHAGYTQAAYEVSKVFATLPGLNMKFGTRLMKHLGYQLKDLKRSTVAPHTSADIIDDDFIKPRPHNNNNNNNNNIKNNNNSSRRLSQPPENPTKSRRHPKQQQQQQQEQRRQQIDEEIDQEMKAEDVWRPW